LIRPGVLYHIWGKCTLWLIATDQGLQERYRKYKRGDIYFDSQCSITFDTSCSRKRAFIVPFDQ